MRLGIKDISRRRDVVDVVQWRDIRDQFRL